MSTISKIYTSVEEITLAKPFVTALRRRESVSFVRVFIENERGECGVGEAPATEAITGEGIQEILSAIERIKSLCIQKELEQCFEILDTSDLKSSAKAALDIALISLDAKERGEDLFEYFKTSEKRSISSAITISVDTPKKMLEAALSALQKGQNILKVKLAEDIDHAIKVTKELSENFQEATLLIDANQAWSLQEAKKYIDAVEAYPIALIEQPLQAQDLQGLQELQRYSSIDLLADESVFTLEDMQKVISLQAATMINIKLMKCGGVREAQKMFAWARENNIKCMLGSMLEGPYSINMAVHLAYANRDVISFVDLDSPMLYKEKSPLPDFYYLANQIYRA